MVSLFKCIVVNRSAICHLLLQIGADVGGEIVNVSEDEEDDDGYSDDYDSDEDEESLESDEEDDNIIDEDDQDHGVDDTKVNLDITAMIAYVSAMTNGRYNKINSMF